jgi:hypothetical protein
MELSAQTTFLCLAGFLLLVVPQFTSAATGKDAKCEVCISMVNRLLKILEDEKIERTDEAKVEARFVEMCKTAKNKEHTLCYYIGATPTSATYIVKELVKPVARFLPADKVCEKLRVKDSQICDLSYDKEIDWKTVDFNKLKVKDLKKILDDWGEVCKGCSEKTEFISRIKELMPKHVKQEL